MELMQFTAIVLLTHLMLKLLLVPIKVGMTPVVGTARWFMTIGIALLDVQFLLQYSLGLRTMGVTQAVLVNLILFVPSSIFISLAIINFIIKFRFNWIFNRINIFNCYFRFLFILIFFII